MRLEKEEHRLDKENLKELQDEILEIETDITEEEEVEPVIAAKLVREAPVDVETTSSYDSYSSSSSVTDEED